MVNVVKATHFEDVVSLWTWGLVSFLLTLCSCNQSTHSSQFTEMNLDQAIYLTKAWCAEAREPFDKAKVSLNGDFRGVFGAAEIVYSAQTKKLSVQGLIIDDASLLIKHPEFFNEIKRAGDRESYTLGEGYFFIDRESQDTNTPQLTLRKDFADGSIKPKQFV